MQIYYGLRTGANKSDMVLPFLDLNNDEVRVEGGIYSKFAKAQKRERNGFIQLLHKSRAVDKQAPVGGDSIILRLTHLPVPSEGHFSLDTISLFITHSCGSPSLPDICYQNQQTYWVVPTPACSDFIDTPIWQKPPSQACLCGDLTGSLFR